MDYQELFNHMYDEHDLILLESEMQEIINIVNKMQEDKKWNENNKHTPQNKILNTCIWDLGGIKNEQELIFDGKLWWNKDKSISGFRVTHYQL